MIIALFVFTNNNGNNANPETYIFTMHSATNTSAVPGSKEDNKATQHGNNNPGKEDPTPYIPDSHHDHDFDCFDFKHHEKRIFWRCIANKAFALIYHLTVLFALVSQFLIQ